MSVIIISSDWRITRRTCPICGELLCSDGENIGCATPPCDYKTRAVTPADGDIFNALDAQTRAALPYLRRFIEKQLQNVGNDHVMRQIEFSALSSPAIKTLFIVPIVAHLANAGPLSFGKETTLLTGIIDTIDALNSDDAGATS